MIPFEWFHTNKKCLVICSKIRIVCETSTFSHFIWFCSFLSLRKFSYLHLRHWTLHSYSIHHFSNQQNRLKEFKVKVLKVHFVFCLRDLRKINIILSKTDAKSINYTAFEISGATRIFRPMGKIFIDGREIFDLRISWKCRKIHT